MKPPLRVVIPGQPQPQGRPRVVVGRGRAFAFDPKRSKEWKERAGYAMLAARAHYADWFGGTVPFPSEPLRVSFGFWFERRSSIDIPVPDFDNLMKAVGDAGNGVLWQDDRQIVCGSFVKRFAEVAFAEGKGTPRTELLVWPLTMEEYRGLVLGGLV